MGIFLTKWYIYVSVHTVFSIAFSSGISDFSDCVSVQYQNRDGVHCEKTVEGLFARAVCHELDHLDGKLYIDVMDRELTPEEIEGHIPEDDNQ